MNQAPNVLKRPMRLAYFHETPAHREIDGSVTLDSAALVDFMVGVLEASGSGSEAEAMKLSGA